MAIKASAVPAAALQSYQDVCAWSPLFRPPYAASPWRFARGNGSEVVNCFCSPDVIGMAIVILAATMAVHSVSNSGWSL